MKKALITGATGFVGKYLTEKLLKEGYEVYGTTLDGDLYADNRIHLFYLDLTNTLETFKIIKNIQPNEIFHLASQSSVKRSWEQPQMTTEINTIGAINLLEAVKIGCPSAKVLLIGSSEEYGSVFKTNKSPLESEKCYPENIYAITKATQNYLGRMYNKAFNLDVVMTRSFNHVGPGQSPQFVISDFCKQVAEIEILNKDAIINVGNLDVSRDFLDVRDVVNAYYELMINGIAGETYNVGSGNAYKIADLLNKIISHSNKKISILVDDSKFRPTEIPTTSANIEKILKDTSWKKEFNIDDTINATLNYWRDKINASKKEYVDEKYYKQR